MSENCYIITVTREKFSLHFVNLSLPETYPSSNKIFKGMVTQLRKL